VVIEHTREGDPLPTDGRYALGVADSSFEWYRSRSILTRRAFRISEVLLLLISAAIPLLAVLLPGNTIVPAVLGASIVVITGMRSAFHWRENYLRYNVAREAVEVERRLYHTRSAPYEKPDTRDQVLVEKISRIERDEMASWLTIASTNRMPKNRTKTTGTDASISA
jgi:hypothetical protein